MYCGSGAAGGLQSVGPVNPGTAFAAQGTLYGQDANYDGQITTNEMGFNATGDIGVSPGGYPDMGGGGGDCADCVKTVTTYKTVTVPCTRNQYKTINVKIPKTVPYTAFRPITKYREITRQVPKTIYVPKCEQVPYTVQEPYTAHKTIFINQPKTTCTPVTKIITRRIPVVNVIPQNPAPCPPQPVNPYPPQPQPYPEPNVPGGFNNVPVDGEVVRVAGMVREVCLHRMHKEGHDTSKWKVWSVIAAQKQIVAGPGGGAVNWRFKVHVGHMAWLDIEVYQVMHTGKVELTKCVISQKNGWAIY